MPILLFLAEPGINLTRCLREFILTPTYVGPLLPAPDDGVISLLPFSLLLFTPVGGFLPSALILILPLL